MLPLMPPAQTAAPTPAPAKIAVAPQAPLLGDAERDFFVALDSGERPIRPAKLLPEDRVAYQWLWNASTWTPGSKAPADLFSAGSKGHMEAQAWRAFLTTGQGDPRTLPLHESGSRLLLWTWMRRRDRKAPLPPVERKALEDRLLKGGPPVLQGWALRHALCFAVAERDNARLAALKALRGGDLPDTFAGVQALFGLLDGPTPVFRLWTLPGLHYEDTSLSGLGASRVWICPMGPAVPKGAAWIIPSENGGQNSRDAALNAPRREEAEAITAQLKGRKAWFAASRTEWEAVGLSWFPILLELDKAGNITSVRMGDAAP